MVTQSWCATACTHYNDVIMSAMASQITGVSIVCSSVGSGRWKDTWKLRVTGLCVGNSPVTGEFPAQRASNAENVTIWWRHHARHNKVWTVWIWEDGLYMCNINNICLNHYQNKWWLILLTHIHVIRPRWVKSLYWSIPKSLAQKMSRFP